VAWPEPEPLWSNGPRHIGYCWEALVIASMIRVGLVRLGASVVRTKWSGALLKCALGCALLAHFANNVRSSQAKCALKIGVRRPSAHLKALQTDFATCALPKCASRAQNPTFAPCLRTSFSALESYSLFLWCFLLPVIAGLGPHNLCLPINNTTVSKSI
jgi:hypothetical protein